ncbi:M56 family metallopeptidase [Lysinibacillus cavernae]|uniref:M56 family metallopeptidase n=1 Tax=Lysinibacillus cavernae TaxID=2666135 RepID=UPI0012D934E3|nr:M56 family metallopeptidase [Lysinibacillus cavernae]
MIQNLFLNILEISLIMSVVILIMYAITPILDKKYVARWKYYVWLVITIRLLIPITYTIPDAPFHVSAVQISPESNHLNELLTNDIISDEIQSPKVIENQNEKKESFFDEMSLLHIGTVLWVVGALLFSFYHVFGYIIFVKNIKRWSIEAGPNERKIFSELKGSLGIKRKVSLRKSTKIQSPMMFGMFKPTVVIPCIEYSETDLYLILKHELIHYKRHDIELKVMLFIVRTLYWFNPFVHLMSKKFDETIEMICDEYVISGKDSIYKKRYMETILHSIKQPSNRKSVFTSNFNGGIKIVKKRFQNITFSGNKKKGITVLAIFLVCCMASSSLVVFGADGKIIDNESLKVKAAEQGKVESQETKKINEKIVGILAEPQPNAQLEKIIVEYLQIPNEFLETTKYYYNYVDLDEDGNEEIFTVLMGPYTSGTGGSTALLLKQQDTGEWQVKQEFTLIQTPIIISDKVTNGNKEIIVMNAGGGAKGNYVVLSTKGDSYTAVNEGTVIQGLEGVTGKAIISNDLLKDMEDGKALYLHKE